jgi:hypothetical protein
VVPPSTREVFGGKRMIPDGRLDLLIVSTSGLRPSAIKTWRIDLEEATVLLS